MQNIEAPWEERARAIAAPRPPEEPVTMAMRFSRLRGVEDVILS